MNKHNIEKYRRSSMAYDLVNRYLNMFKEGIDSVEIFKLDEDNISIVSQFMAGIKPEWWDAAGAKEQLRSGVGWHFGLSKEQPKGWILCKTLDLYKTVEVECLGYDDNGIFKIGKELQPLIETMEEWAKEKGFTLIRFTIGSRGLSCHLRKLGRLWEELRDIRAVDREEYDWFLSMGYLPHGILPNIYGDNQHGILLIKQL
jgi:hypothetical protein